ncbi:MAG: bifunctional (p)ppGpp synthetase/guanosine-3',5'-bis(diphosphate) 3'-pyrophosphohydrolase [Bacteroidales bacterium]|nr:bifunctional (p)ppGpp synthetase/guanosine-3',5'-bis(diphosphate) 3'-pyrophosphohydrolase [Bacteroidales bacterium]
MSFSEFTARDYELIAREYAELKEMARKRCTVPSEMEAIQKAFDFANEAHKNVRRRSGEPYILHPIAVAKIVVGDIGLGYKSISAALLHDVVEDTDYTVEDIGRLCGQKVAQLVDGLTKIKTVLDIQDKNSGTDEDTRSLQAENFKRILLTLGDDVRVVLIKLADRLHNCRTIEFMPEYKRDKILSETMFIFIPLAHRLGLYGVKSEMENIWLRYKEPEAYNDIAARINRSMSLHAEEIEEFIRPIEQSLLEKGFNLTVKQRVKTPYSIWRKMQTKGIPFDQVYDLYAIRIIFTPPQNSTETERDQCYHIFSIITSLYSYKADRVRDWVKHPKSNGYEALHCTLQGKTGMWVEVQIRSKRMDDIAEKGIAAHWAYKKEGYVGENDSEMDKWLAKIKEILVSPDINALELLDIIHNDLTNTDITVFTPKGEQRSIQKGSTALDFAYQIHTEIGEQAIAAKVNMRLMPLSCTLHSGDMVEIITAEDGRPHQEWLSFLQTRHARNKVMDYFRATEYESIVAKGREDMAKAFEAAGIELTQRIANKVAADNGFNHAGELLFRCGLGMVDMAMLASIAKERENKAQAGPKGKFDRTAFEIGSETDGYHYIIADCCRPIAGDPVVGFLDPDGHTVTVHKKACTVAEALASKYGDRIVMPYWNNTRSQSFLVRIALKGLDRMGLVNEITRYISHVMVVNIKKLSIGSDQGIFDGYIDLQVHDRDVLEELIKRLRSIKGIQSVQRTEIR